MAYIDTKHFNMCETCKNFIEESWCDVPCVNYEFYSPNISKIPTADVVEVKHGEWEVVKVNHGHWKKRTFIIFDSEKVGYQCSECNTTWDTNTNYCPNCGAKMDGRSDTDDR